VFDGAGDTEAELSGSTAVSPNVKIGRSVELPCTIVVLEVIQSEDEDCRGASVLAAATESLTSALAAVSFAYAVTIC